MRRLVPLLVVLLAGCLSAWAAGLDMEWAYHDDADDLDDRAGEMVPGETFAFLGNGNTVVGKDETVTIYVLTMNQFAGEQDEQVFVRWWNGKEEKWVMGSWVKNVTLGEGQAAGKFHDQPTMGEAMLDLWKIEIGPEITEPGENYYVIQLKGWSDAGATECYLLRDMAGDAASLNEVNQAWTSGDYTGHDWSVTVKE